MAEKRRRLVLYTSPFLVLVVCAIYGRLATERLQAEAEELAVSGQAAIRLLGEYAQALRRGDHEQLIACFDPSYTIDGTHFWEEQLRSTRDGVQVFDLVPISSQLESADVTEQFAHFYERVSTFDEVRFKLDVVEQVHTSSARVRAVLWLRGTRPCITSSSCEGSALEVFETQVKFRLLLQRVEGREQLKWRIADQDLLGGVTVSGSRRGFTEVAEEVGLDFIAQHNPMFKTPDWSPTKYEVIKYGSAGVSAADYDSDGFDDLFFADGQSARLYRNSEGGRRFIDVTSEAGLPIDLPGINVALFVDFDNDGDRDLFLGRFTGGSRLYRNEGNGTFADATAGTDFGAPFVVTAAAADYDLDGDVDLYLGRYLDPRKDLPTTFFYTRNGEGNSLLRNDGNLLFTEVTTEAGVRDGGLTVGVAWGDHDGDGDPDLYVANDFGRNALFRNDYKKASESVRFTDIAGEQDALDLGFGMSASFGDVDNDGDFDLLVSNIRSGQRWYGQATTLHKYLMTSLRQGTLFEDLTVYKDLFAHVGIDWRDFDRVVKGNSLLLNNGVSGFTDIAHAADAAPFGWYWGSVFLDFDNDGWQDIYAANGWISGERADDL